MKNFGRAVRLALRFKWRLAGLFLCALAVGVLWGANITTLFPLMEISFKGRNPQQWVRGEIADAEKRIAALEVELQEKAADPSPEAPRKRILLEAQIDAERRGIEVSRQIQPFIDAYMPSDAFHMLALVVGLLLAGTIIKSFFYVIHSYLADSIVGLTTYHLRREFYRKTLKMDQARFSTDGTSELLSRFTFDMENLSQGLKFLLQMATREPLKMLACFIGAAVICWQLLLFSLIVVPIGALAVGRLSKLLKSANRKAMEGMSRLYAVL
ncbi:MAG TPA: ABC transporter transmembrane domain-containing protein, partial [Pirellulales bacterium]